jgi:hypothetical protein
MNAIAVIETAWHSQPEPHQVFTTPSSIAIYQV